MEIDLADVKAEVEAAFAAYETALGANDVTALEAIFHDDPRTIRYGIGENLYGMNAIRAFRRARSPVGIERTIEQTVITTYGRDFATASTLFRRRQRGGQDRPPDAELGAVRGGLARGGRACEPDRRTGVGSRRNTRRTSG